MAAATQHLDWDEFPDGQTFQTLWKLSTKEQVAGDPNTPEPRGMLEKMIQSSLRQRTEEENATLRDILGHIRSLCEYDAGDGWGDEYRKFDPKQHIYRREIINGNHKRQEVVSDGEGIWTFRGLAVISFRSTEKNYWALHDLLGLFFSKLGPAPPGASRLNFYLPLLALYTRWVYILTLPSLVRPSTYAIMWGQPERGDTKTPLNIYLGSTPGGIKGEGIKNTNKQARFGLLTENDVPELHSTPVDVSGESKPWGFETKIEKWAFGNCAETYSYLQLLLSLKRQGETRPVTPNGFSIQVHSAELKQINSDDEYDENVILRAGDPMGKRGPRDYENLANPCRNCAHVIRTLESEEVHRNFQTHINMGFGDPRPRPSVHNNDE